MSKRSTTQREKIRSSQSNGNSAWPKLTLRCYRPEDLTTIPWDSWPPHLSMQSTKHACLVSGTWGTSLPTSRFPLHLHIPLHGCRAEFRPQPLMPSAGSPESRAESCVPVVHLSARISSPTPAGRSREHHSQQGSAVPAPV